ncbi:hypothetical protein ARTHROSP310_26530 [Arthrobacter sp. AD-310]
MLPSVAARRSIPTVERPRVPFDWNEAAGKQHSDWSHIAGVPARAGRTVCTGNSQ